MFGFIGNRLHLVTFLLFKGNNAFIWIMHCKHLGHQILSAQCYTCMKRMFNKELACGEQTHTQTHTPNVHPGIHKVKPCHSLSVSTSHTRWSITRAFSSPHTGSDKPLWTGVPLSFGVKILSRSSQTPPASVPQHSRVCRDVCDPAWPVNAL